MPDRKPDTYGDKAEAGRRGRALERSPMMPRQPHKPPAVPKAKTRPMSKGRVHKAKSRS